MDERTPLEEWYLEMVTKEYNASLIELMRRTTQFKSLMEEK